MLIEVPRAWFRLGAALSAIAILHGQEPPPQPAYRYEVVSIHRADPAQANSGFSPGPQGGLRARNVTVVQALTFIYGVEDYQILGAPGWARTERFEISFTPDRPEIVPDRETGEAALGGWRVRQRQRMGAVMRDRFHLAVRGETRDLPMYALTVAKNGPRLKAPEHPAFSQTMNINGGRQLVATTASMKSLAQALAMILGHAVRDETGLDGAYDFKMDWTPDSTMPLTRVPAPDDPAAASDAAHPSIFTALTEQLGLRLKSRKGPVQVYVVEMVERPEEN